MNDLNLIPKEDLISMLKEKVWYSGNRTDYELKQGYSLEVEEETAIRDVVYRGKPLYQTPEQAIIEYWKKFYGEK